MKTKIKILFLIFSLATLFIPRALWGQQGTAGLESVFSVGVGARALGLGGASTAYPDDASAFHWNPAGMMVVPRKSLGFTLTTLFEGTDFQFVGYIHPTLGIGTFGVGIYYMGTGGIKQTEWDPSHSIIIEGEEFGFWTGKLTLAYALTVLKGFSIGTNLNVIRQVMWNNSTNGFGLDLGLHYGRDGGSGLLSGTYAGIHAINVIPPRLKLGVTTENEPFVIRGGAAKRFTLGGGSHHWLILGDVSYCQYRDIMYHIGTEYSWDRHVFLRVGYDNGELSFGGGLEYANFQIDYATSRIGDPLFFARSHRFTLTYHIGKSIAEQRQIIDERQNAEIQRQISERMEAARQRRISEGLRQGKEYFDREDYFNARLEFSRVLSEDPENTEAQRLMIETASKEKEMQQKREADLVQQDRANEQARRDNAFVGERFTQGLEGLEKGDYRTAIRRWTEALQRDPQNPQLIEYIRKAWLELENEVNRKIFRANQLMRQDNLSEAYRVLSEAKEQTEGDSVLQGKVLSEIRNLDRVVNFYPNYQEGLRLYNNRNYQAAIPYFEKALRYDPNHVKTKELLRISVARSRSTGSTEMTKEVRELFNEGIQFYNKGHYEKALEVWEKALELDPYNEHLIKAIEGAKKRLETYKKENK
ncbi:MAG TPA: PorV/PorQ family protein [bacterium]|nr:PorV/PorQ family protein [bacterium]